MIKTTYDFLLDRLNKNKYIDIINSVGDCQQKFQCIEYDSLLCDTYQVVINKLFDEYWMTIEENKNFKLQIFKDAFTSRILNNDEVISWGRIDIQTEKFNRISGDRFFKPGDIVGVCRKLQTDITDIYFEHYGIYTGDDSIIHYCPDDNNISFDSVHNINDLKELKNSTSIHSSSLNEFLDGSEDYFIMYFAFGRVYRIFNPYSKYLQESYYSKHLFGDVYQDDFSDLTSYNCCYFKNTFNEQETIKRATLRLGERNYSIMNNNCESFAFWCKTGNTLSHQVIKAKSYYIDKSYRFADNDDLWSFEDYIADYFNENSDKYYFSRDDIDDHLLISLFSLFHLGGASIINGYFNYKTRKIQPAFYNIKGKFLDNFLYFMQDHIPLL